MELLKHQALSPVGEGEDKEHDPPTPGAASCLLLVHFYEVRGSTFLINEGQSSVWRPNLRATLKSEERDTRGEAGALHAALPFSTVFYPRKLWGSCHHTPTAESFPVNSSDPSTLRAPWHPQPSPRCTAHPSIHTDTRLLGHPPGSPTPHTSCPFISTPPLSRWGPRGKMQRQQVGNVCSP